VQDVRVDQTGKQRCWNCGGFNFTSQRTTRSKVAFGVGALLANPKLRCVRCGEYNDTGSAKPYAGPSSRNRQYQAEWADEQRQTTAADTPAASVVATQPSVSALPEPEPPPVLSPSPDMVSCPRGHESPAGTKFCPSCGSEISVRRCPNGHPAAVGQPFCSECGAAIDAGELDGAVESNDVDELRSELTAARARLRSVRARLAAKQAENKVKLDAFSQAVAEYSEASKRWTAAMEARSKSLAAIKDPRRRLAAMQSNPTPDAPPAPEQPVLISSFPELELEVAEQLVHREKIRLRLATVENSDVAKAESAPDAGAFVNLRECQLKVAQERVRAQREKAALPPGDEQAKAAFEAQSQSRAKEASQLLEEARHRLDVARDDSYGLAAEQFEGQMRETQERITEIHTANKGTALQHPDWKPMLVRRSELQIAGLEERRNSAVTYGDEDEVMDLDLAIEGAKARQEIIAR
jgi:hypothetical protein